MSKLFLDLSKMTAAGTKGDKAIFAHKDGHEIHVHKSKLSPKMKADLEALVKTKMAKGGEVKQSNPKLEESKKLPPMADGGEVADIPLPAPDPLPGDILPIVENNNQENQLPVDPISSPEAITVPTPEPSPVPNEAVTTPNTTVVPSEAATTPTQAPSAVDAGPANLPAPRAPEQPGLSNVSKGITGGIQEQRAGIEKEAQAKVQMAKDTVNALAEGQIQKDLADKHFQDQLTSLEHERNNIAEDIKNQHIRPDAYISDMSVPGKLMTGIGLILGGIGGGMTHQENPALKYLNAQIDRNIDAQAKELGKKETLLSANMRQFGNIQQARDFTRVQHNDMIKNMIDQAAAKAGTPMAQAEALKAKGQLDQQSGMLMAKIGAIQTINSPQAGMGDVSSALQTLRLTDPEQAKEIEGRLIPGVGIGNVPIPQDTRGKILAHQQLDERAKDLLDFASKHTGSFDPKVKAAGQQKVLALQSLYREGTLGTVYREGEQPLLDKIVKDPTSFFNNYGNIPKLKELINSNDARYKVLKNEYGIRPLGGMQQPQGNAPRFSPRK